MPTLVLSPRYTSDSNRLWDAALTQHWDVYRLQSHYAPEHLQNGDAVFYGEGLFVRVIAQQLEVSLFETPANWLAELSHEYTLRNIQFTSLREARLLDKAAFIKPALDKTFDARVYSSGEELPSAEYFDDDTPTLVSEPVEWECECRCFISERQLHSYATYSRDGKVWTDDAEDWTRDQSEDQSVEAFVNRLLADPKVLLPPATVIDVGVIKGRGWAVIEANPAWASGLYGNTSLSVLRVLQKSCLRTSLLTQEQQKWVIDA